MCLILNGFVLYDGELVESVLVCSFVGMKGVVKYFLLSQFWCVWCLGLLWVFWEMNYGEDMCWLIFGSCCFVVVCVFVVFLLSVLVGQMEVMWVCLVDVVVGIEKELEVRIGIVVLQLEIGWIYFY